MKAIIILVLLALLATSCREPIVWDDGRVLILVNPKTGEQYVCGDYGTKSMRCRPTDWAKS